MDIKVDAAMKEKRLAKLIETYGLSGFTPQPANPHLRNIARIIAARQSDRECVETLTEYLLLNGISVGDQGPADF